VQIINYQVKEDSFSEYIKILKGDLNNGRRLYENDERVRYTGRRNDKEKGDGTTTNGQVRIVDIGLSEGQGREKLQHIDVNKQIISTGLGEGETSCYKPIKMALCKPKIMS
jgi:hypothetical protein